jgi:hydrogenase expression/formation protein HypD
MCHVRVPPVLQVMLNDPQCQVQGLLAAGNVCAVMGQAEYDALAAQHRRPIVVTGFSAVELLQGILQAVIQLEQGEHRVENGYRRAATNAGNRAAQALLQQVFQPIDCQWRGLGWIPGGGLALREPFAALEVERRAAPRTAAPAPAEQAQGCISGLVLQGLARPSACPRFGRPCTPEQPLGAPMVSSEGACAAYYRYQR